jgi:L-amino acid N-acyltransferase YncA
MTAARIAEPRDAAAITAIYNAGIEERVATFETRPRNAEEICVWFDGHHPVVVVERSGSVVAFAATSAYRHRHCYRGIAEFSVYVDPAHRGQGHGCAALSALIGEAERAGFHKLVSRIFVENAASRKLVAALGFREVGVYERHGMLDGVWRDVVIVERLLNPPEA